MTVEKSVVSEHAAIPLPRDEALQLRPWGENGPGQSRSEWSLATETSLLVASTGSIRTPRDFAGALLREFPNQSAQMIDLSGFRDNAASLERAVAGLHPQARLAYSVKANPRPEILELIWGAGVRFYDCASLGEISLVRHALPCPEVVYNYDNKERYAVESALRSGVRRFAAQDAEELDLLLSSLRRSQVSPQEVEVGIRLCSQDNVGAQIPFGERFGAPPDVALALFARLDRVGLIRGLYVHPGSQVVDAEVLAASAERACEFAKSIGGVRTLNLGGGVPVGPNLASIEGSVAAIRRGLRLGRIGEALEVHPEARVIVELGRALAAPAVTLLTPILKVDHSRRRIFLASGLFDSFSDHVVHDIDYQFEALAADDRELSSDSSEWIVFGPTCDPGDRFRRPVRLPSDLESGDALMVPASGAYLDAQGGGFRSGPRQRRGSGFNGRSGPLYVAFNLPDEIQGSFGTCPLGDESLAGTGSSASATPDFRIENLAAHEITDSIVGDISELFLEVFCNDWQEWVFCTRCDPLESGPVRASAKGAYGCPDGEVVSVDRLIEDPLVPFCKRCSRRMELFHHPWATFEKLRSVLRDRAWLTVVRRGRGSDGGERSAGEIVGFTFAYEATLRSAFESEWRLLYPYSLWSEKERHTRSFVNFRRRVSATVAEHFPDRLPSCGGLLPGDTPIVLYNCFALRQDVGRARGLFRTMCEELLWKNVPTSMHDWLSLGESRFGTLGYRLLTAAGFTPVPGVLDPGNEALCAGDYTLGMNLLGRYALGLVESSGSQQ